METITEHNFLTFQIELKRKEMMMAARNTGFCSQETLSLSRELDQLLNLHRGIIN
jgi:hypothetical protein